MPVKFLFSHLSGMFYVLFILPRLILSRLNFSFSGLNMESVKVERAELLVSLWVVIILSSVKVAEQPPFGKEHRRFSFYYVYL